MTTGELQTGLQDLGEHGAVLECGECLRAVVVPEWVSGGGLLHLNDSAHKYERPNGSTSTETVFPDSRSYAEGES